MFLSKHSNGFYYIYYTNNFGKRNKISTKCRMKSEAMKFLTEFKRKQDSGDKNESEEILFSHFKLRFLIYSETINSLNHTLSMRTTLNEFGKYLKKDFYLSRLTRDDVVEFIEHRLKKVSAYTVKRDIADLSSAFNWAISKHYLSENLAKGIKKPRIPEKLPLYFTEDEFKTLLDCVEDEDLRDIIIFAVMTGIRQSDLIALEWSQINLPAKSVLLDNRGRITKSQKVHSLPMNGKAFDIINKRKVNSHSSTVFTYHDRQMKQHFISHKFAKIIRKSKLNPKLNFHSLRHTFATWMVQRGVPIYQVSKLMTHSDLRVTQIYAHLTVVDLQDAVNKLI